MRSWGRLGRHARAVPGLLAAALLAGCSYLPGPMPPPSMVPLGGTWRAVDVAELAPVELHEPRLQFLQDGRITGEGGCNMIGGKFRVEGGRIEIRELSGTLMGCQDPQITRVESAFIRALGAATTMTLEGDVLVLDGPAGRIRLVRS